MVEDEVFVRTEGPAGKCEFSIDPDSIKSRRGPRVTSNEVLYFFTELL